MIKKQYAYAKNKGRVFSFTASEKELILWALNDLQVTISQSENNNLTQKILQNLINKIENKE